MADNYDKIAKLVKANKEIKQSEVAQKLGVTIGQVGMLDYCKAQVEAGLYGSAPATATSVKKLRDSENNRWELIAARTGLSVSAVKTKYEEAGGDAAASYTGRGRNRTGSSAKASSTRKSGASKSKAGASGSKAKSGSKKTAAAGRKRGSVKSGAAVRRNRTGRRSVAGNPS